jgi:MinD superfamily P-loop ATPase
MKKLLILSGKGGTGKTTVAAAFIDLLSATAFADCDVDAPNLNLVMKFESSPDKKDYYGSQKAVIDQELCNSCGLCLANCRFDAVTFSDNVYEINEIACEGCGVCHYVCPVNAVSMNDDVAGKQELYKNGRVFSTATLKMGRGNSGKLVTEVKKALFQTASGAKIAVIDGSPGIGCPVIASISGVDFVLIVAEPSLSGLHDLERIQKTASIHEVNVAVCVNKADTSPESTDAIRRFCETGNVPFVGSIPYDKQTSAVMNAGHSLASVDCPARDAIKTVLDNTLKLMGLECEY